MQRAEVDGRSNSVWYQPRSAPNAAPAQSVLIESRPRHNLMTIDEVAAELRCSVRHIHNLMRRGHLKFFRHGGKMVRIHRTSVERYIAEWSMGGS